MLMMQIHHKMHTSFSRTGLLPFSAGAFRRSTYFFLNRLHPRGGPRRPISPASPYLSVTTAAGPLFRKSIFVLRAVGMPWFAHSSALCPPFFFPFENEVLLLHGCFRAACREFLRRPLDYLRTLALDTFWNWSDPARNPRP